MTTYRLWGCRPGRFDVEVEGEFAYGPQIVDVLGEAFTGPGTEIRRDVELVAEDHGISVRADGRPLGVLADREAFRYGAVVRRIGEAGFVPVAPGRIWAADAGVYNRDATREGQVIARVSVSLGAPGRLAPRNDPPHRPYTLLPAGRTLQVSGESEHARALRPYSSPSGKYAVLLTLHPAGADSSTGGDVEVRLDGRPCGRLGRRSSEKIRPVVAHLAARGLITAVCGAVAATDGSVEVTVSVASVESLGAEVLDGDAVTIPALRPAGGSPSPEPSGDGSVLQMHRYHGHGGQIVIHGDSLWILREGPVARLRDVPRTPRRIRLSEVKAVEFRPALPRAEGLIRPVTADNVDGHLGQGDPDTVEFHHGDRRRFQSLGDWLGHVAATNAGPPP